MELRPKASALYQCVQAHFAKFEEAYPTRYQEQCSAMRIIAFTEQPEAIEKILSHLGLWPTRVHSPPVESVAA